MGALSEAAIEAIKTAIQMEKDGLRFYEEAAGKTDNELAKKTFQRIARDEAEHLKTFKQMFDTITGTEAWRDLAKFTAKVGKVPMFEGEIEKKGDVDPSDVDALRVALDNERKGIEHYRDAAAQTADEMAKQIYGKIEQEEVYHYDLLQAQLDSLTKSGFWLDIGEFQMDGKY